MVSINQGITVFKFFIWGGISSDIQSEIAFYGSALIEYGYPHSNALFKLYSLKPAICIKNISCVSDVYSLR